MSTTKLSNFINGKFQAPVSGKYIDNINPCTAELSGLIPDSDYRDAQQAIDAANAALSSWKKTTFAERAVVLRAIAAEMKCQARALAETESRDMGKPITFSMGDTEAAYGYFDLYASLILTDTTPYYQMADAVAMEHRNAIGVVGLISPWNFPLHIFSQKVSSAIACGNTCVAKPSELSPNSAALMCKIFAKVGVPNGVINVIFGYGPKVGQPLVESDIVRAISFTGGSVTGKRIAAIAAPKLKKLQLELGGKNSSIVFADCYFDETVGGVALTEFLNTGQVCCSGSRLLVERSIYKKFILALKKHVAENWMTAIGDPLSEQTLMGPLVSRTQFEKVKSYLELAKREGGTIIVGGGYAGGSGKMPGLDSKYQNGYFVEPTIVCDLDDSCRCAREEIFGPILTVHQFDSEDDAIRIANEVDYGLAGTVWTSDIRRGQRVARQLEAGSVWINCYGHGHAMMPFGGFKNSGIDRENGLHSIRFMTELKAIVSKL